MIKGATCFDRVLCFIACFAATLPSLVRHEHNVSEQVLRRVLLRIHVVQVLSLLYIVGNSGAREIARHVCSGVHFSGGHGAGVFLGHTVRVYDSERERDSKDPRLSNSTLNLTQPPSLVSVINEQVRVALDPRHRLPRIELARAARGGAAWAERGRVRRGVWGRQGVK